MQAYGLPGSSSLNHGGPACLTLISVSLTSLAEVGVRSFSAPASKSVSAIASAAQAAEIAAAWGR